VVGALDATGRACRSSAIRHEIGIAEVDAEVPAEPRVHGSLDHHVLAVAPDQHGDGEAEAHGGLELHEVQFSTPRPWTPSMRR
jgi:hypothetical protein